jgi:hypothetical protein
MAKHDHEDLKDAREKASITLNEAGKTILSSDKSVSLPVKLVLIYDEEGNYIVHGCNSESPQDMFTAVSGLWPLDPQKETVRFLETTLIVPKLSALPKIRVYGTE